MSEPLSKFKIKHGRKIFDAYNGINSFSFALVTGNTITLYAMALNASGTVIGLLTAFMYMCYFSLPLGKLLTRRFTIVQTFCGTWFLRNLSLLPILAVPYFYFSGNKETALLMLLLAVALFNFFRGAGIIANNPVIGLLSPGKDRNSYIVRVSLTNNGATLIAIIFLTIYLRISTRHGINLISTYNITAIIGIITGFAASALLLKLPDPEGEEKQKSILAAKAAGKTKKEINKLKFTAAQGTGSFFSNTKDAFGEKNFRLYILSFFIIQFGISLARPFIIVYGKSVYSVPDNLIIVLSLASTAGSLLVGLLMRLLIDRMGAKPMYIIFTALSVAALLPAIAAPARGIQTAAFIFLILFSMFVSMGFTAQLDAAQAYFFGIIPNKAVVDLSMLYFIVLGITGAAGSVLGGKFLDSFAAHGFSNLTSYRFFFFMITACIGLGMLFQSRLLNLGGRHVRETLAVIFSPRDMKALNLLYKLNTNENLKTEEKILQELTAVASTEAADTLNQYLHSPRFSIRYSALHALKKLDKLSSQNKEALLEELQSGEFTTAALAANILAHFKVYQAVPFLREALMSADYLLAGEAMLALAELNDTASQFKIAQLISNTVNPKLLLSGIDAMGIYGSATSIPLLLDILRREALPAHIEDEAYLVLASIMKIEEGFYYVYNRFKNESKATAAILSDVLDEAFAKRKQQDMQLKKLLTDFSSDADSDSDFIKWILNSESEGLGLNTALLASVAMDIELVTNKSFRFFLCYWAACIFQNPKLAES